MDSKSWVAERDKLHHHIMTAVSESQLKETTVFKGGTIANVVIFALFE